VPIVAAAYPIPPIAKNTAIAAITTPGVGRSRLNLSLMGEPPVGQAEVIPRPLHDSPKRIPAHFA
jgi:hypothetical protein